MSQNRENIVIVDNKFKQMTDLSINFLPLKRDIFKFLTLIQLRKNDYSVRSVLRLIEARTYFNNCLIYSKSIMSPEFNIYIANTNEKNKSFEGFNHNLGIANARLDMIQRDLDMAFKDEFLTNKKSISSNSQILIHTFRETLVEYMNAFIINTYKNTQFNYTLKYIDPKTKLEVVKDKDWFVYLLFQEFYRVSEIEGALARQILESNRVTIKQPQTQFNRPQTYPDNTKFESTEEVNLNISDPFADLGDDNEIY